jgi:alpha-mannosidase
MAYKTNLLEDKTLDEVKIEKNRLKFIVKPYEITIIKANLGK